MTGGVTNDEMSEGEASKWERELCCVCSVSLGWSGSDLVTGALAVFGGSLVWLFLLLSTVLWTQCMLLGPAPPHHLPHNLRTQKTSPAHKTFTRAHPQRPRTNLFEQRHATCAPRCRTAASPTIKKTCFMYCHVPQEPV